jgi:DtxR family Mn-dependent transcriptional regulator
MIQPYDLLTQEYIEVISELIKRNRVARVKDIAGARQVSSANVSIALTQLAKKELVSHEQYGHVSLTAQGRRLARDLNRRHQAIKQFLIRILGIEPELAEADACKIEHVMSPASLTALSAFLEFESHCPRKPQRHAVLFASCSRYNQHGSGCNVCRDEEGQN